jgi:hypothetical protein
MSLNWIALAQDVDARQIELDRKRAAIKRLEQILLSLLGPADMKKLGRQHHKVVRTEKVTWDIEAVLDNHGKLILNLSYQVDGNCFMIHQSPPQDQVDTVHATLPALLEGVAHLFPALEDRLSKFAFGQR